MAFVDWSTGLSVSVEQIDSQHQRLIAILNELHAAMKLGHGNDSLVVIFDELLEYTKYHFGTEEKLFDQYGYPEKAAHTAQHQALTKTATELQAQFNSGKVLISTKVLEFLKGWVANHILQADKAYTEFFHSVGVR